MDYMDPDVLCPKMPINKRNLSLYLYLSISLIVSLYMENPFL